MKECRIAIVNKLLREFPYHYHLAPLWLISEIIKSHVCEQISALLRHRVMSRTINIHLFGELEVLFAHTHTHVHEECLQINLSFRAMQKRNFACDVRPSGSMQSSHQYTRKTYLISTCHSTLHIADYPKTGSFSRIAKL